MYYFNRAWLFSKQKVEMTCQISFCILLYRTFQLHSDLASLVLLGQNVRPNRKPYNIIIYPESVALLLSLGGEFGALMQVHIQNDGPVTLQFETPNLPPTKEVLTWNTLLNIQYCPIILIHFLLAQTTQPQQKEQWGDS